MVLHINKDNFNDIQKADHKVLLDFYADWCGPCRMVGPILEQIAAEHPEFIIAKVNVDQEPELAAAFEVMSIPSLIVLEKGQEIQRSVGAKSKAKILELLA